MWDVLQGFHPKTLSTCWIIETCTSKRYPEVIYRGLMEGLLWRAHRSSPLHLKIVADHSDSIREGRDIPLELRTKDCAHA